MATGPAVDVIGAIDDITGAVIDTTGVPTGATGASDGVPGGMGAAVVGVGFSAGVAAGACPGPIMRRERRRTAVGDRPSTCGKE